MDTNFIETMQLFHTWKNHPKIKVANPEQLRLAAFVRDQLQAILLDEYSSAQVNILPCPLDTGALIIEFTTDVLVVRNTQKFSAIVDLLDNFEIYPISEELFQFSGVIENCYHVSLIPEGSA